VPFLTSRLTSRLPSRLTAAVLALVVSGGLPAVASPSAGAPPPAAERTADARAASLASTGYVLGGASDSLVAQDAHGLATLGVDGVSLARNGGSVSAPDADLTRLLATAHAHGLRAELLLSNYSNRLGDFDPRAAARLLRDPAHVQAVAGRLASFVAAQGWDGIQVDLESMARRDADGLLMLVTELQSRMAPEKSVSIAVMASTDPQEYVARGYRLAELGAAVDTLALMTYDQHGPWSGPGPIGALGWQRRAVGVVTSVVPAAKVDLGVAGYGYTWPRHREGRTVTDRQARRLVARDDARARWRTGPGEWTARLFDGTRLWWSEGRSSARRLALAPALGLHGLALGRLGSADPLP
jgi:spore germination protein YaaH